MSFWHFDHQCTHLWFCLQMKTRAEELCALVGNPDVYAGCTIFLDASRAKEMCMADVCSQEATNSLAAACNWLRHYGRDCLLIGKRTDWEANVDDICAGKTPHILGSTSMGHRSDRCLVDVDARIFAIWTMMPLWHGNDNIIDTLLWWEDGWIPHTKGQ